MTEGKVEECARYEVQHQDLSKKIEDFEYQVSELTAQLSQA